METSEILKRVRQIEIKTRGLSSNIFAGEYHSAFKGRGMAFSEVREYQYGDDIRDIEWNVTARFNRPYVKVFEEERELTVMLLVDVSGSLKLLLRLLSLLFRTMTRLVSSSSVTMWRNLFHQRKGASTSFISFASYLISMLKVHVLI